MRGINGTVSSFSKEEGSIVMAAYCSVSVHRLTRGSKVQTTDTIGYQGKVNDREIT